MVMIKQAYAVDSCQVCGDLGAPIRYKSTPNLGAAKGAFGWISR